MSANSLNSGETLENFKAMKLLREYGESIRKTINGTSSHNYISYEFNFMTEYFLKSYEKSKDVKEIYDTIKNMTLERLFDREYKYNYQNLLNILNATLISGKRITILNFTKQLE